MNIDIINPCTHPHWDDLLHTHPKTTFFHTAAWANVLSESYNYKPLYFTIIENGKLVGLIPVMEINSVFTGKRGVSLPFTDICHPIAAADDIFREILDCITLYGKRSGWKYFELRGGKVFLNDVPSFADHFTHIISLTGDEAQLNKSFRDSTRRNIKKAVREKVDITLGGHSREHLEAFYGLHCQTRKHHGLPSQPWLFFEKIHAHIIGTQKGFVALAAFQGRPVAGAVYFLHRERVLFKFGASDRRYLKLRLNHLLMWEAIKKCSQKGFKVLDLGRTEKENDGLRQFKNGWDSDEKKLWYYQYDLKKDRFVSTGTRIKSSYAVFKHLPMPILRLTGHLLYHHTG
jgi:hypothetical protein